MGYADAVKLSKAEWKKIEEEINSDQKSNSLITTLTDRLSRKRCKERVVKLVSDGDVVVNTPRALYTWTYGSVQVKGADTKGIPGHKEADVYLSEADWKKEVTKDQMANMLREHMTEKRAAMVMLSLMWSGIFKPSAVDVVDLTNERVKIDGVEAPVRRRKGINFADLIAGIE